MKRSTLQIIIEAEHTLARAHIDLDIATIDALLHEDYVVLQPGEKVETKRDVIDSYRTGLRHWVQAEVVDSLVSAKMVKIWHTAGRASRLLWARPQTRVWHGGAPVTPQASHEHLASHGPRYRM
jgi:hypothetical protein